MISINDACLIDRQLGFHGRPEIPAFPHVRRYGSPRSLPNQIVAFEVDAAQLHREAESMLRTIEDILRRGSMDATTQLSGAVMGIVPVHVNDDARRYLGANPTVLESAIRVTSALSELVGTCGVLEMNVTHAYDIELETEKIVIGLRAQPSSARDAFEHETRILSSLASRLSDDDKLRIAVRVE
jgi:hypothetical protein